MEQDCHEAKQLKYFKNTVRMAGTSHGPEQVGDGVQCFNKKICGYFNEDGLSRFAFSSWHDLLGTSAGENAEGELSLDAKMKLLRSNLTKFERSLRDGRITHIPEFLKQNGLQHPLVHPDVVTAVCSYLLYLVSCHSDPVLVNSAANTLSYHVERDAAFAPDRAQILAIALNMGMNEEYLPDFSRDELPRYVREEGNAPSRAVEKYPEPFNVQQVVGSLTELLRPGRRWTEAARDTLFSVLVAMLVDPYMGRIMMASRVTICLDRLLQGYERSVWSSGNATGKVLDLVEELGRLPREARLPVLAGLPPLGRGLQLRHLTGYLYLQYTINEQHPDSCSEPPFFDLPLASTVGGVLALVRGEQVGGLPAAVFSSETADQLLSCNILLHCIDAAVGSEPLPDSQLENLRQLKELLHVEVDRVRDNPDDKLELRMRLKDFMAILHSKWSTMCKKQT